MFLYVAMWVSAASIITPSLNYITIILYFSIENFIYEQLDYTAGGICTDCSWQVST